VKVPAGHATVILKAAMSDEPKKPWRDLEKLAEELVESINEEPEMEPGQADTTPAVPTKDDSKQR
jgi:hypothetical protein